MQYLLLYKIDTVARPGLEPRSKAPGAPMLAATLPGYMENNKMFEYIHYCKTI